jgi:hypothetical protein
MNNKIINKFKFLNNRYLFLREKFKQILTLKYTGVFNFSFKNYFKIIESNSSGHSLADSIVMLDFLNLQMVSRQHSEYPFYYKHIYFPIYIVFDKNLVKNDNFYQNDCPFFLVFVDDKIGFINNLTENAVKLSTHNPIISNYCSVIDWWLWKLDEVERRQLSSIVVNDFNKDFNFLDIFLKYYEYVYNRSFYMNIFTDRVTIDVIFEIYSKMISTPYFFLEKSEEIQKKIERNAYEYYMYNCFRLEFDINGKPSKNDNEDLYIDKIKKFKHNENILFHKKYQILEQNKIFTEEYTYFFTQLKTIISLYSFHNNLINYILKFEIDFGEKIFNLSKQLQKYYNIDFESEIFLNSSLEVDSELLEFGVNFQIKINEIIDQIKLRDANNEKEYFQNEQNFILFIKKIYKKILILLILE